MLMQFQAPSRMKVRQTGPRQPASRPPATDGPDIQPHDGPDPGQPASRPRVVSVPGLQLQADSAYQTVHALHKVGRVFERHAFHKQSLIQQHARYVGSYGIVFCRGQP